MNRRDLLKYFGIGTTITPVVGGNPLIEAAAQLLAVPDIKPVLAKEFPDGHAPAHFQERLAWNPYEVIWLRFWQIENDPLHSVGPLEHILRREPTDAEKAAVAGVVQWFGTNCGHSFIEETLRATGYRLVFDQDERARAIKQLQHHNVWQTTQWSSRKTPTSVRIERRGRFLELEPGKAGEVR